MPLHDTFKKRTGESKPESAKVAPLIKPPTVDDLRFCMGQARQSGRPSALSWKVAQDTYILTASIARGANEPTWILHVGDMVNSAIVWTYTTGDTELIFNLLWQVNELDGPKAEIPEALRPKTEETAEERQLEADHSFPLPHEEFSDKYEILSRVGFGGMGVIFKAVRKDTREIVALKLLHGHLLDDPENTKRFMQEASACSQLKHRNLINVFEYGVSRRGQPFMIMEYLEGHPLTSLIESKGRLEIPQFINLFTQICDGLQCAHERGVVHRDVKPSNIMVVNAPEGGREIAKVLDFGIAKFIVETERKLTPTGNVLGSPAYIAPEQCAGGQADPRADVYALGCVMYEALAGRPPFLHESAIKVLLMQLGDPPPPLSSYCPDVPADLEEIIMHCLEKDPEMRYASASDLATELWAIAALRSQLAYSEASNPENTKAEGKEEEQEVVVEEELELEINEQDNKDAELKQAEAPNSKGVQTDLEQETSRQMRAKELSPDRQAGSRTETTAQATAQSKIQPVLTIRLKRCRSFPEIDCAWEGLNLALKIQARDLPVTLFLDTESVLLVMRPDMVARFNIEAQALKRIATMQAMLQQLLKCGATVLVSERWARRGCDPGQLMPGVLLLNDDEICDLILERTATLVDY